MYLLKNHKKYESKKYSQLHELFHSIEWFCIANIQRSTFRFSSVIFHDFSFSLPT